MEQASTYLPPISSSKDGLPIYFLTGHKYFYQTLFCIRSLHLVSKCCFRFILVDDGSFDGQLIDRIKQQLPGATIVTKGQILHNLQNIIPLHKYPQLHHKRAIYPHIKKLTDIHTLSGTPWKLVLDSDMLFWNDPVALTDWLTQPTGPLHLIDCDEAYGYSSGLMKDLCGEEIKPLINVGAIGLDSSCINWDSLEQWIGLLEEKQGTSYYLEQALTAMIIGERHTIVLDASRYIVNPCEADITNQQSVLHHYVDLSKEGYYKKAWQKTIP
ncbi:hypothetical protein [Mucilaginibacter aquaedulcis]|uniref:hypothetical protein n=1 Tax=Mucilaginibacter aquaedulcis TaxID=1187081 RepID=UPI0025B6145E|nr:hypothetical protein [Mucilaginibacter aquaedulcis]MDN3548738.1 hypothetical protein [Mucilaginibacter aquaedulcis]